MAEANTGAPLPDQPAGQQKQQPQLEITASRQMTSWMAESRVSFAFTTYQTGKLFLIGLQPENGRLSIFERTFNRAMGLYGNAERLWLSTLYQLWTFDNFLMPGQAHNGYDKLYVPRQCWVTGDLDIHDIVVEASGRTLFVNTLFGCVATMDDHHSFKMVWKPPFLSKLAAEDRCHLNGLAMENGRAKYVTAVSRSDAADGWRDRRRDGGIVMDIETNEVLCEGLSMPHSPRVHQGKLWVLNSGGGYFGYVDRENRKFVPLTFMPGYARGMAFIGDYAVIGLSLARENKTFQGLPLDDVLKEKDSEPRCGLMVVDLRTGDIVHWLRIEGVVRELYDVVLLPGVVRPMALGFKTDEIRRIISVPPEG